MSTILLADDNPHARRMGSEILVEEGHQVVTVESGDEAVAWLDSHRPDLVLADTEMPGASGYELCGFVRSQPEFGNVKVVLLHPPLERFDERLAAEVGTDGVLQKPLDAEALIETVSSLLENNGAAQPPKEQPGSESLGTAGIAEPASDDLEGLSSDHQTDDPFAEVVEQVLSEPGSERELRDRVHSAVAEVMEIVMPALVDRITERVLQTMRKG